MEGFLSRNDCFLVHYGDVLTDQDFSAMLRFHRERRALGTLLLHRRARSNSVVEMDDSGRVTLFLERPRYDESRERGETWVNSGVCILSREIFQRFPEGFADLPRDVFPDAAREGRLFGFPLSGYRCAVDSPKRYSEVREAVRCGACRIDPEGVEEK